MKYKFNINNLDCANCARKVEEYLSSIDGMEDVSVNFNTLKLTFYSSKEFSLDEVNKLVKEVEPDCFLTEEEVAQKKEYSILVLIIATILGVIATMFKLPWHFNLIATIISYALLLYRPFINAIKMLIRNKTINENALITISCIGAFIVNEKMEGMMVAALYILGKILEEKAINNTRSGVKNLLSIKQDYANLKQENDIKKVNVSDVKVGDILLIRKGEKIPVDGKVISGSTYLDVSCLTGEADLLFANKGDEVLSGSINNGDVVEIEATSLFSDSLASKILDLVLEATDKKAKTETMVAKLSKVYTPIVLLLAILTSILLPIFSSISYGDAIYRGLTFLVISCPCAIAISVPLSYFTGIGVCSKNGILVKGSNYLDNLARINKIVFDKTGTLTTGTFNVKSIEVMDNNYTKDEIVDLLVKGEALSIHPIARSICSLVDYKIDTSDVKDFKSIEGLGISYTIGDKKIVVGNKKLCDCNYDTSMHFNINGKHVASILLDDGIKKNAHSVISKLHDKNIDTLMFTGDKKEKAYDVAKSVGIDLNCVKYEILPDEKYKCYEEIHNDNDLIAFVGDGINDAPTLKRSDVGISMGGIGTSAAIEASDVVIMADDLMKINDAIDIAKYTNHIIKQNLIFAILVKIVILILTVVGIATMWFAVFADTGVTLLTILNTLRIRKRNK